MFSKGRARRGGALIGLTGAAAIAVLSSAGAHVGGVGTGAPATSAAPDLLTAKVVRTVNPNSPLGPQARLCFDAIINTTVNNAANFFNYDSDRRPFSNNLTIDTTDEKCVIATLPNGVDITQATVATMDANGVVSAGGVGNPEESAPLEQLPADEIKPVAGATTGPDLVSTSVDAGATPPQITYTFDEFLDPALPTAGAAATALAGRFGFYIDTDDGAAPRFGTGIAGIDQKSITVTFASVTSAKQFFVNTLEGGGGNDVRDVPGGGVTEGPIGSVGPFITGGPTLVSASKQAGSSNQIVDLKFSQAVIPGAVGGAAPDGNVVAYRADAGRIGGTYAIGTSGADTSTLPVTMPPTTQKDAQSVVRIGIRPGLVRNQANDRSNTFGAAAISTEPTRAGYTDGPDLLTATVDDATNRVTYTFDEALQEAVPPDPTLFRVINADGTTSNGQAGTAVVGSGRTTVSVKFGGSVSGSSIAGVSNDIASSFDEVTDTPATGNRSPEGSVSLALVQCQPGTCPVGSPTATPTVSVTPTPTATQPPQVETVKVKTKVTAKKKGKKIVGKVKAAGLCKSGRKVSAKGKSTKSKGNGSYSLKFGKKVKGAPKVKVAGRTIRTSTVVFKCSAASTKAK